MLNQVPPTQPETPRELLSRIAMPIFLFSVTLLSLLTLSWAVVLPQLTAIEVGGVSRDSRELSEYAEVLKGRIEELQGQRDDQVIPLQETAYRSLADHKVEGLNAADLYADLVRIASRYHKEGKTVVHLALLDLDPSKDAAVLTGDVRNTGFASMTVLAAFIEELRELPWIVETGSVRFERKQDAVIGTYSPFSLHLTLHDA